MGRSDLERLSKEELIELVLRLQRPQKTSRTSSKPPSTDRKERRDQAKPGGAKRLVSNYLSFRVRRRSRMRLIAR